MTTNRKIQAVLALMRRIEAASFPQHLKARLTARLDQFTINDLEESLIDDIGGYVTSYELQAANGNM